MKHAGIKSDKSYVKSAEFAKYTDKSLDILAEEDYDNTDISRELIERIRDARMI